MTRGRLAYAVAVSGQLSPVDGAVELTAISIDLRGPAGLRDADEDTDGN